MNRSIIAVVFTVLCMFSASAETESAIVGRVTDSEGAVIANARVLIHWDSSGSAVGLADNVGTKQDVIVFSDANGRYEARVPPGFYDVFISATAFTPIAGKARVKEGRAATFGASLRADPLVTKELGDEFPAASRKH